MLSTELTHSPQQKAVFASACVKLSLFYGGMDIKLGVRHFYMTNGSCSQKAEHPVFLWSAPLS